MITVRKSPSKAIKLILGSAAFVAIGIWMLNRDSNSDTDVFMAWAGIFFFGLGIVVGLTMLFDRKVQIRIDENGVWDRTTKLDVIPWSVIKEAYPIKISGQGFVSLVLDKNFESKVNQQKWATKLSEEIGAQKVNIHVGHTKVKAEKIAELINKGLQSDDLNRKALIKNVAQQRL